MYVCMYVCMYVYMITFEGVYELAHANCATSSSRKYVIITSFVMSHVYVSRKHTTVTQAIFATLSQDRILEQQAASSAACIDVICCHSNNLSTT